MKVNCPELKNKSSTRIITAEQVDQEPAPTDPWICIVSPTSEVTVYDHSSVRIVTRKGSTYQVKVEVEGVGTMALLDHGAQVSLVRKQLLPHIREKQGWTLEQCHSRNLPLDNQPFGAGGKPLGVTAVVLLTIRIPETEAVQEIPCYVLDSSEPLWSGEMIKCGVVLGTNALSSLGFNITHPSAVVIQPITESENSSKAKGTDTSQRSIKEAKDDFEKDNSLKSGKDKESGHNKETIHILLMTKVILQ